MTRERWMIIELSSSSKYTRNKIAWRKLRKSVQWGKYFSDKHEDLKVSPRRHVQNMLDVVVCAWGPCDGEVETGRS